jgi:glycerol kinase
MQRLADILDAPVERPVVQETTALGAAWLAGHKAGAWPDAQGFGKLWKLDRGFKPTLAAAEREKKYTGWKRAVAAVLEHSSRR